MATDSEGSIIDVHGNLRHFGIPAFQNLADDLDRCFVCGIGRADTIFNDEHVIPNWILSRFKLHSSKLTFLYKKIYNP